VLLNNLASLVEHGVLDQLLAGLILNDSLDTYSAPSRLASCAFDKGCYRAPSARVFGGISDQARECRFTFTAPGDSIGTDIEHEESGSGGAPPRRFASMLIDGDSTGEF